MNYDPLNIIIEGGIEKDYTPCVHCNEPAMYKVTCHLIDNEPMCHGCMIEEIEYFTELKETKQLIIENL